MKETAIITTVATVLLYDTSKKNWIPAGGRSGKSKIVLNQSLDNRTYRIIGTKKDKHTTCLDIALTSSLVYNEATAQFHQWRLNGTVYELQFNNSQNATDFAKKIKQALKHVKGEEP